MQTVSAQLKQLGLDVNSIWQLPIAKLDIVDNQSSEIWQTPSAKLNPKLQVPPDKLISHLSFSHLSLLLPIKEPLQRTFYEIECIKGTWSVSELKRQIGSLYFERSGLSKNPEKLSTLTGEKYEKTNGHDILNSPFTFEFLGLRAKEIVEEDDLEQALINHLQDFMLELGN